MILTGVVAVARLTSVTVVLEEVRTGVVASNGCTGRFHYFVDACSNVSVRSRILYNLTVLINSTADIEAGLIAGADGASVGIPHLPVHANEPHAGVRTTDTLTRVATVDIFDQAVGATECAVGQRWTHRTDGFWRFA